MESCLACDGVCCRVYRVPITGSDLRRIMEAGRSVGEFVGWLDVGSFDTSYPDVRLDDGYKYMVLARRQDGTCVLAKEEDGRLRCGIHGHHPLVCRIYPFNPFQGGLVRKPMCRRAGRPYKIIRELGQRNRAELKEYLAKVERWNRGRKKGRSADEFLEFILAKE